MQNEDRPAQLPITDVFEALRILGFICEDNHIDPDLFQIFELLGKEEAVENA